MRRTWHCLARALLLVMPIACGSRPASETVRIGHLAAFSGPERQRGERSRQGVQLALQAAHGETELASSVVRSIVVHVDHRGDPAVLQAEAVRLISVNRVVALIGACDSGLAEQLLRTVQPYGVPLVLTSDPAPARSGVVPIGLDPAVRGRELARFALQQLKADHVTVVVASTGGQSPLADAFLRECRARSSVVQELSWEKESELAEMAKLAAAGQAKAVLVIGSPGEFRKVEKAFMVAGFKSPFLYGGPDAGAAIFANDIPAAGVYLVTAFAKEGLTEAGQAFARRCEETFQDGPNMDVAQGYDAMRLVLEELRSARARDRIALLEEFGKLTTFETVTGPLTFKTHQPRRPGFLLELKPGSTKLVSTVAPDDDGPAP